MLPYKYLMPRIWQKVTVVMKYYTTIGSFACQSKAAGGGISICTIAKEVSIFKFI